MTRYFYDRGVAIKEGYRISEEIDKSSFKRPVCEWHKNIFIDKNKKFIKDREYLLNNVTKLKNEAYNFSCYEMEGEFRRSYLGQGRFKTSLLNKNKTNKLIAKTYKVNKLFNLNNKITLKELIKKDKLNKRGIYCYVEKQENTVYTLRDLTVANKDEIYNIELNNFYDIAGKVIYINISKKDDIYKVNQIQHVTNGYTLVN